MSFEESLAEDIVRTFSQRQKPSKGTVLNKIHHDFNEIEEYWTALEQGLTPARINALPFSTWVAISPLGYAHYFPKFMELTLLYPVEMRGNEYMRTFEISLDNLTGICHLIFCKLLDITIFRRNRFRGRQ